MELIQQQQYGQWLTDIANTLDADDAVISQGTRSGLIDHPDVAILEDANAAALGDEDCKQYIKEEVREALARLENGIFGLCEACGDPIAEDRLEAIPYARYCSTCGERLDPLFLSSFQSVATEPRAPRQRQSDVVPLDEDDQPFLDEAEPDIMPPQVPTAEEINSSIEREQSQ